ncbi:hypothetical protein EJ02DRAFT_310130, partial [Clathrospora elynae]
MLAREVHWMGEGGIEAALSRNRCDVLISQTLCVTLQIFAAKAGSLVISVPVGV